MDDEQPAGPDAAEADAPNSSETPAGLDSVLLFDLGGDTFALPVDQVRRVVRPSAPVRLPGAPAEVLGVINLRGTIVAIVDPRVPLGLPPVEDRSHGRVLVTDVGVTPSGLLVDAVRDVVEVDRGAMIPSPVARGIAGVMVIDDRSVVLLDASELVPS